MIDDNETIKKEKTERMHSIVLKEKDKDDNWLSLDVDQVIPIFLFGEQNPMVMGIVDDRAYFIPFAQMNWFEQNYGVKNDTEVAKTIATEKLKRKGNSVDASFS